MSMNNRMRLATLSEEPIDEDGEYKHHNSIWYTSSKKAQTWLKTHFSLSNKHNNKPNNYLNILLSVLGCPLFPVSQLPSPDQSSFSQVSSSAQYIIQHFTAATGCRKLEGTVRNMYATGKVTMAMVDELSSNGSTTISNIGMPQKGCFVMWQMVPNKWLIELVVGGHKVIAGSDGNVAWQHTPWLGSHAAKGGVRPLRRALNKYRRQNSNCK